MDKKRRSTLTPHLYEDFFHRERGLYPSLSNVCVPPRAVLLKYVALASRAFGNGGAILTMQIRGQERMSTSLKFLLQSSKVFWVGLQVAEQICRLLAQRNTTTSKSLLGKCHRPWCNVQGSTFPQKDQCAYERSSEVDMQCRLPRRRI